MFLNISNNVFTRKARGHHMKHSFISIITVNYNGKKLLKGFLGSVNDINYPKDKYEVIVVDNASIDGSVNYIKKNHPKTKVIESSKNLGFGVGNNLGIKMAQGDYVFLVNNDTYLDPDILMSFNEFLSKSKDRKVAAYNAKMVLVDCYLDIRVDNGIILQCEYDNKKAKPVNNTHFNLPKNSVSKLDYLCHIPIMFDFEDRLKVILEIIPTGKQNYKIYFGKRLLTKGRFENESKKKIKITLSKSQIIHNKKDLIQNAGNIIFRNAYGRDRGVIISGGKQYFEVDSQKFNKEIDLDAFCGAGVFITKSILDEVGFFDKDFFMYYEDMDLSLRMKKAGYEIKYCPDALVRHIHSASSKEWSDFFIYHAERGRLLILVKHWPILLMVKFLLSYMLRDMLFVPIYQGIKTGEHKKYMSKLWLRFRVILSVMLPLLKNLVSSQRLSYQEIGNFK